VKLPNNLSPKANCVPRWIVGKYLDTRQRTEDEKASLVEGEGGKEVKDEVMSGKHSLGNGVTLQIESNKNCREL
jgi:hypothetical protein